MPDQVIIFCAKYLILVPVLISGVWWVFWAEKPKRIQYVFVLVVGAILAYLLSKVGAHLYSDPRPFVTGQVKPLFESATDNGFPSDHTLLAAVVAAAMWPFNRKLSLGLFGIAVVVGTARVLGGVHHPADVVGSLVIGSVAVFLAWLLSRPVMKRLVKDAAAVTDASH